MNLMTLRTIVLVYVSILGCFGCAESQEPAATREAPSMHTNKLIGQTSPYLLQHAHNPVSWYPWGPEAFELAKQQNKPIFLSVGYSTCYWCHVMERESFERDDVAAILNEHYISIKVDREERPELDQQFMVATQLVSRGRGGWPNSVWLTPDGKPWMAGTYFPREQFKQALLQLSDAWKTKHDAVLKQADVITAAIESNLQAQNDAKPVTVELINATVEAAGAQFDSARGGFSPAPKFPPHDMLAVLIDQYQRSGDKSILDMIEKTLTEMARGGVYDQLGGGFHRYSTDNEWLLPHYEKMLYDNGQLVRSYTDGYRLTSNPILKELYREAVEGIYVWTMREMTSPEGGFFSAIDSESDAEEGKFYVWSNAEIVDVLGEDDSQIFASVYGVKEQGNFREEATGKPSENNILHRTSSWENAAKECGLERDDLKDRLVTMRAKLLQTRSEREYPHLDDKVIAAWNGLMIEGLAYAGRQMNEPKYVQAAQKASNYLLSSMFKDGRLQRTSRGGKAKLNGYLNDYAFVAKGFVEVYRATEHQGESGELYLEAAVQLAEKLLSDFQDPVSGGFFFTALDGNDSSSPEQMAGLVIRSKNLGGGGNIPSGNGIAAKVLLELADLEGNSAYREAAKRTLEALSGQLHQYSGNADHLLLALAELSAQDKPTQFASKVFRGTVEMLESAVAAGETVTVKVQLTIDDGWHLYGDADETGLFQPTTLTIASSSIATAKVIAPRGIEKADPVMNRTLEVYERQCEFELRITVKSDAPPGDHKLQATLKAQACDDKQCIAPAKVTFKIPITVAVAGLQ